MEDQKDSSPVTEGLQPPDEQTRQFIPSARRALGKAWDATKDVFTSAVVIERKIPLEEITERKVAEVIDQNLYNPLRETLGQDKRLPFDVTHVLTNMGYISATPDNYHQEFPDAYRLSRIALLRLYHQGILDIALDDEGTNVHGEDMHYKVIDEEKLQDYLRQPKK